MLKQALLSPVWVGLIIIWVALIISHSAFPAVIPEFGPFMLLGIIGAVFANATGAGGGVVFVPFFQQLQFSAEAVIATSFAIQCCGMSAGAISWLQYFRHGPEVSPHWRLLLRVVFITALGSLAGIGFTQYGFSQWFSAMSFRQFGSQLHIGFGIFSVLLALGIFASIACLKREATRSAIESGDIAALLLISFVGGVVTAYLSVGVGELIAVYLIFRGFSVSFSIAAAVILSAISVWGGVQYHAFVTEAVVWDVVLFAGAGAIIGGRLARYLVLWFSPRQVKVFFAGWVLLLGIASLI
ncbi:sulfite exporter TauE/SafE family protein [Alteromonas sp. AMM-1]|uniref:sulfite exporter TauE/SafE family protein n=1 Tax=Alteromonas sp. AMM-1 TaxID=3394233 RepID=UPI0039A5D868